MTVRVRGLIQKPWEHQVGRWTDVAFLVETYAEATDDWSALDISAVHFQVRLRTWTADVDAALLTDDALDKSATTGWVRDVYDNRGIARDAAINWEAVLVDTDIVDADSPSGYQERQLFRYRAPIQDVPQGAAP